MIDTEKYHHAQKRQALAQALGEVALKSMEEAILQSVRKFCRLLKDEGRRDSGVCEADWSSSKDVAVLAGHLSFDVMSQVCFGHRSDMLEKKDNRYILGLISDGAQCLNTVCRYKVGPGRSLTTYRLAICRPCFTRALTSCFFEIFFTDSVAIKRLVVANASDALKWKRMTASGMYSAISCRRFIPSWSGLFTHVTSYAARAAYLSLQDLILPLPALQLPSFTSCTIHVLYHECRMR